MDEQIAKEIWQRFMADGTIDARLQPVVAKSWQQCRRLGVDPYSSGGQPVSAALFQEVLRKNKVLLKIALPIMQSVYDIIKESHFLLALTDRDGHVLATLGDKAILERSENILFRSGSIWSNKGVGSNAPGIALEYDTPIQMNGAEHYCLAQHSWTCSAAPIHGAQGQVVGSLDLSGPVEAAHLHTLALVVAGAFSIEMLLANYYQTLFMRAAANGLRETVLLLDENCRLRWCNRTAQEELGLSRAALGDVDFRKALPAVDWQAVWHDETGDSPLYMDDVALVLQGKRQRFSATISRTADNRGQTATVILRKQEHFLRSVNRLSGNQARYSFADIVAQDAMMRQVIAQAGQYARYDGSVLIEGESGTGKELFAQAIHRASPRRNGPFVAVNCASLPRDLIESELFGYERGAFTGALKEGNPGKFELADHGTLFLDEIGEMPMEFQAKLLRAVETLTIRRIGGKDEKHLDVRVIAATNRDLKGEVRSGAFRGDLYYRLNVLKLDIPPLRERPDDISYCADAFLARFNERYPERQRTFSRDAVAALRQYSWPGNVRELQNSIERAFYVSTGPVITPADFHFLRDERSGISKTQAVLPAAAGTERDECRQALVTCGGNVVAAARQMGVSKATFYRLCKQYGIVPKDIRRHQKS